MDSIRHRITGFIKKHSAAAICAAVVASAVLAGTLQVNIADVSAAKGVGGSGVGKGNQTGRVTYDGKGSVDVYVEGPEVGITPKVYSYSSVLNNPGQGNSSQKSRDIYTYNEKKAYIANRRQLLKNKMAEDKKKKEKAKKEGTYNFHYTSLMSGAGWDVHSNPINTSSYVITMANAQRREMTAAAVANMAEQYGNGTIVFVPKATVHGKSTYGDIHWYTHKMEGNNISDDTDTNAHHAGTHIFFDYTDSGLGEFFDKVSVKGLGGQRAYNRSFINQQIIGNSLGIFRGYIRDMEKANEMDKTNKNNCWSTYEGKDGKQHYYQNQASDMNYINEHLNELLGMVQKSDRWYKALDLYALAANVYESGSNLYMQPRTLQDYVDIVTYKSLKGYEAKAIDMKKVRAGNTRHELTHPYPSASSTEDSIYNYFMKAKTFADLDIATKLIGEKYASRSDSIVASYIQGEWNLAYLDMLLCGYSIAYHMQGNNSNSAAAKEWENAISAFVKAATGSGGANFRIVSVRFDIGALGKSSGNTFYHASHGTMARSVLKTGNGVGFTTPDMAANSKTIVKSFIGIQTQNHANRYLIFNANNYIRSYKGARDAGNYYSRLKKASMHNNGQVVTDFSHYTKGSANRLFDFSQIDSRVTDSNKGGAGSEDYVELLSNGLTPSDKQYTGINFAYNYGSYATFSLSWWNATESELQLALYINTFLAKSLVKTY